MADKLMVEKAWLKSLVKGKDTWMYRAILLAQALEHLGYNPHNIMNANKEILTNGILKSPEKVITDFQI